MSEEMDYLWLQSPGLLMLADSQGKLLFPRFLQLVQDALLEVAAHKVLRLMINLPFQHGKTTLCTRYFCAWWLLNWPDTRILLGAHETTYARQKGAHVRDTVGEWGPLIGIHLKQGTKDKSEWEIDGYDGGMVSRGMKGSVQGRPADLFVIEDPYKDWEDAQSEATKTRHWHWYTDVVYPRLSRDAPIVVVSTRWAKDDLCGKILRKAEETMEPWTVLKFPALAKPDDPVGRSPGEPLFPECVSRQKLEIMQKNNPMQFRISYQMEDGAGEGTWFKVKSPEDKILWPQYWDLRANAWSFGRKESTTRRIWLRDELFVYITIDWAYSKKKWADYTAMGVFGLTPAGELAIFEVIHEQIGVADLAPRLAEFCTAWHPSLVACETGHPMLREQCGGYAEIPELRWLSHGSQSKLTRNMQAITMGENGKILLPVEDQEHPWVEPFCAQLMSFTGLDDDHEDMVDMLGYAANLSRQLRGYRRHAAGTGACVLTAGRDQFE